MGDQFPKVRAAVVQAAAVVMDREATVEKTIRLIDQATSQGARLIVFPEAFIPAYPWGIRFGTRIGGRRPTMIARSCANGGQDTSLACCLPPPTRACGNASATSSWSGCR